MMIGCRPIKAQQFRDGSAGATGTASGISNILRRCQQERVRDFRP